MPWTDKIPQSEVAFMNEIIKQVPDANGARQTFIHILESLAENGQKSKFQFYMVRTDDADVVGTDDEDQAQLYADNEDNYVIDVARNQMIMPTGDGALEVEAAPVLDDYKGTGIDNGLGDEEDD